MNLSLYLSAYILILFSILGYGYIFYSCIDRSAKISVGYLGLYGIFLLIFIAYISNFITPHGKIFNMWVMGLGLFAFFVFLFKNFQYQKVNLLILFSIFFVLVFAILHAKTHDDFTYYHFPYIHHLTSESVIFGVGNFNHGYKTASSIFYLSSFFYLPKIEYSLIHLAPVFIMGFVNFELINKIKTYLKDNNKNFIILLSLLSLTVINIFFYRLAEHGTDRSAQILVLLTVIEILFFLNFKSLETTYLNKIYILIALIISLKAFYILYVLLLIPIIISNKNKLKYFEGLLKNNFFYISVIFVFFVLLMHFVNTGCLLFPVASTCNNSIPWGVGSNAATALNNWYHLWSKAGANPNFRINNPEEYLQGFNWVHNWTKDYFFNKVSDYILGISFTILIFFLLLKNSKNNLNFKRNYQILYFIILLIFFEWFYNHPALRYGGYHLIALIIFIPFSLYLEKYIDLKTFYKKICIVLFLILIVFIYRNVNRIYEETKIYNYNFLLNPSYNKQFTNYNLYKVIKDSKKIDSIKILGKNFLFFNKSIK